MAKKKEHPPIQPPAEYQKLYAELRQLITNAKSTVVRQVNQILTVTYWQIGKQIQTQVLDDNRAEYGKQTMKQLAQQLTGEFGKGFTYSSLTRMVKFYLSFDDEKIVATLSQQLSWSHFVELIKLDNGIQREFYTQMSSHEGWSVRTLRQRMDGMLFERSAIAKQPEQVIRQALANLGNEQQQSL